MGIMPSLDDFAAEVRSHLWVLDIEPAFQIGEHVARFMWAPYTAELQSLNAGNVRLALSAHNQLVRTVEYPMDEASAKLVADGIIALLEPEG